MKKKLKVISFDETRIANHKNKHARNNAEERLQWLKGIESMAFKNAKDIYLSIFNIEPSAMSNTNYCKKLRDLGIEWEEVG